MSDLKVTPIDDPEKFIEELRTQLEQTEKGKYSSQVGIRDVKFALDKEQAEALEVSPEMTEIAKAEVYLQRGHLVPIEFVEYDGTVHRVLEWDPTVIGRSGFMDCVAHSMVTTERGVFEVGRYPALNIEDFSKTWQWFIHRRVEASEEKNESSGM